MASKEISAGIGIRRSDLHRSYAEGVSPRSVILSLFERIEQARDPGIFIALCDRGAVLAAADALPPFDPERYPLWGLPFAVKDNIDVAALPTTAGCPAFAFAPAVTAFAVRKLLDAGALLVGKTNLDQFATGLVGTRSPYGVPRNAICADLVPGGSSSGSAVAVARGLVTFALGTDTAGSGRVPAALNNIVGLKPSFGAISTAGVLPACRTLDCVSVFAATVDDAWAAFRAMAVFDPADVYARDASVGLLTTPAPAFRVGVPSLATREFFGDTEAERAFDQAVATLQTLGATVAEFDFKPFREIAELLYGGPWIAERYRVIEALLESNPDAIFPVTRTIIENARTFSAADAFAGFYKLAALKRRIEPVWQTVDILAVPSIPTVYTREAIENDPVALNAKLGLYTNFVNLLDLAAIAIPTQPRSDGRPAGVTLIGKAGGDAQLAAAGRMLHGAAGVNFGAVEGEVRYDALPVAQPPADRIELAVVGAHLSGMPLNGELIAEGAIFLRAAETAADYRLYALAGAIPKPGLLRVGATHGANIACEVWALPPDGFGRFVAKIPPPLGIGTLRLSDGTSPKGFLVESESVRNAADISNYGGWRPYLAIKGSDGAGAGSPHG